MFHLVDTPTGPQWRCTMLKGCGVFHGFTTRRHRVPPGDAGRAVVAALAGVAADRVTLSKQVHGRRVTRGLPPDAASAGEADAHVTASPGVVVAVRTADCVPVLLCTVDGRSVAAVHAGWRGLVAGIIPGAVEMLHTPVADPRLLAAVGPCISVDHYEVGEEVAVQFRQRYPDAVTDPPDGGETPASRRPHLDLRAVAVAQLCAAGLAAADVAVHPACTFRDADLCHSYRRDGAGVAHHAAWIMPAGPVSPGAPG